VVTEDLLPCANNYEQSMKQGLTFNQMTSKQGLFLFSDRKKRAPVVTTALSESSQSKSFTHHELVSQSGKSDSLHIVKSIAILS